AAERAAEHWHRANAGTREHATAIRLRGIGHQLQQDYPAAIAAYRQAVDLYRSLDRESVDVAIGLSDLADAEKLSGDYGAAERDYREALLIDQKVNNREGVAIVTGNLASLALDRRDWLAAETLA